MATWDDVTRISLALPETIENFKHNKRGWGVGSRSFGWERPLRPGELREMGDAAPDGEILALRTADFEEQRALAEGEPEYFFVTPWSAGHPIILVKLDAIPVDRLTEAIEESWVTTVPKRLSRPWLADRGLA